MGTVIIYIGTVFWIKFLPLLETFKLEDENDFTTTARSDLKFFRVLEKK